MPIYCHVPLTPSSPTVPNINHTKTTGNLVVVSNVIKNWLELSLFLLI